MHNSQIPRPTASSQEVRAFLIEFFRALYCHRTLSEATEMATRIHADGIALYEIPEKKWVELFDLEGQTIYHACMQNKYIRQRKLSLKTQY